jgi:frataxin
MDDTAYHRISEDMFNGLLFALEPHDESGVIEVECQAGILTIGLRSGKQIVVSKHAASREIWLASPLAGGLHFSHAGGAWALADGRTLGAVLAAELKQLAGLDIDL